MLIILIPAIMVFALVIMLSPSLGLVNHGRADFSNIDFSQNRLVALNGKWEFYWNKFLTSSDFISNQKPQMDSLIKVPATWNDKSAGTAVYPNNGVATYRLILKYPSTLKDPALRIKSVATAYKLYTNGRLVVEVGNATDKLSDFKDQEEIIIIDLPNDTQEIELIFQVANLKYATGGLRDSPVFGSKQVLEQQKKVLLTIQLFFIGSVFIFGIHYFFLFLLQNKNKTALLFSFLCFITVLRSLIWGETPILFFMPDISFDAMAYINYFSGYNLVPIIILFIISIFPLEYKKRTAGLIMLPTLVFDVLLVLTTPAFMSSLTNYLYILMMIQMIYVLGLLIKAVLCKRDNAVLMFIAIFVFVLAINIDILYFKGIVGLNLSYMFLYGNIAVIIAMSYAQAKQQENIHKKLILYNENLLEADRLKDKIMSTEMSFLQAQIKPHFLYNALNAIANVCEKDGQKAGKLIIDLAIYLRGSLEFNNLDKMTTIEKELEFVDTYFNIEQARFGQKIQLKKEIEIPLDVQIPVLILQPLVENSVRHGISKKSGGGTVFVRMKQINEGTYIEIEDDGVGISGEKLSEILKAEGIGQGVGILNIHNRLIKLYGRGLEISSEAGHTCVKIMLRGGRTQ